MLELDSDYQVIRLQPFPIHLFDLTVLYDNGKDIEFGKHLCTSKSRVIHAGKNEELEEHWTGLGSVESTCGGKIVLHTPYSPGAPYSILQCNNCKKQFLEERIPWYTFKNEWVALTFKLDLLDYHNPPKFIGNYISREIPVSHLFYEKIKYQHIKLIYRELAIADFTDTDRSAGEATAIATILMASLEEKAQYRLSINHEQTATDLMHELSSLHYKD